MNKYNGPKDYEKTLKDNKPRIVMPIINTIVSVILFVLVIIFTVNKMILTTFFILIRTPFVRLFL